MAADGSRRFDGGGRFDDKVLSQGLIWLYLYLRIDRGGGRVQFRSRSEIFFEMLEEMEKVEGCEETWRYRWCMYRRGRKILQVSYKIVPIRWDQRLSMTSLGILRGLSVHY